MHQSLSDLKLISGVVGAFVFDPKRGILASEVPQNFKRDKLAQAGRLMVKSLGAGRTGFEGIKEMVFNFAEMYVLVRDLRPGVVIVVICQNSLNVNLLVMSLNLAMEDLSPLADLPPEEGAPSSPQIFDAPAPAARPAAAPAAPPSPPQASAAFTHESIMEDKALGPVLVEMKAALAKAIGPMASIIMQDSLKLWIASSQPSKATLKDLVEIICTDVGDPAQCGKFRALTTSVAG